MPAGRMWGPWPMPPMRLKSMVTSLGARRAGRACENLELLARNGHSFVAQDLVDIIVHETRAALVEVEKLRSAA